MHKLVLAYEVVHLKKNYFIFLKILLNKFIQTGPLTNTIWKSYLNLPPPNFFDFEIDQIIN